MKKLLGIMVLGLLLSACVNQTANELMFSKAGKEKKENIKK